MTGSGKQMVREILCYHGTSLKIAEKIYADRAYKLGLRRDDHWLGHGTYFFEEDSEQAELWGQSKYKSESTATLETSIVAERDKILNLNTRNGMKKLEEFIKSLEEEYFLEFKVDGETPIKPTVANAIFTLMNYEEVWVITRCFPIQSRFDKIVDITSLGFTHEKREISYTQISPQVCVKNLKAIQTESIKIIKKSQAKNIIVFNKPKVKKGSLLYDDFDK